MKDEHLLNDLREFVSCDSHDLDDQELSDAFRSVREEYDGTNAEASVTLQRALFRTRKQASRQRFARWGVVPIAAVLAASTAWAGVTGRLAPVVQSVLETMHGGQPRVASPVPVPVPVPVPETAPAAAPERESESKSESEHEHEREREREHVTVRSLLPRSSAIAAPVVAPPPPARSGTGTGTGTGTVENSPAPVPVASAPDPHAQLFEEAHRIHFVERDPARALAAWDRYLAVAPAGRFSPEARYNRALTLVRLSRAEEAKPELEAFARGTYGSYRQEEAKALLDALGR